MAQHEDRAQAQRGSPVPRPAKTLEGAGECAVHGCNRAATPPALGCAKGSRMAQHEDRAQAQCGSPVARPAKTLKGAGRNQAAVMGGRGDDNAMNLG